MTQVLATSVARTEPRSITFEVSDEVLADSERGEWSEPVQFRFEQREDGRYDLVMRTVGSA
jgi:hypothetical protein